jgi:hypothetical protein
VTLRFLADQRHVPSLAILSQGLSFIAMIVAMVAMFSEVLRARSASFDHPAHSNHYAGFIN